MPRRFQFSEGASNKFWEISRNGKTVTVRFGRIGTDGQSQDKVFSTEAEAELVQNKLIREKFQKGYVEQGSSPETKPASVKTVAAPPVKVVVSEASVATTSQPRAPGEIRPFTRRSHIADRHRRYVRWFDLDPLPSQEPKPFDFDRCFAMARRMPSRNPSLYDLPLWLSKEEAWFWYCVLLLADENREPDYKERLWKKTREEMLSPQALLMIHQHGHYNYILSRFWVQILMAFVRPLELAKFYADIVAGPFGQDRLFYTALVEIIHPVLSREERAEFKAYIEAKFKASSSPGQEAKSGWFSLMCFCGWAGLPAYLNSPSPRPDLLLWVSLPSEEHLRKAAKINGELVPNHYIYYCGNPVPSNNISIWLAATEWRALPAVVKSITGLDDASFRKEDVCDMVREVAKIEAPETAQAMVHLRYHGKGKVVAADWLDRNPFLATIGLVPLAMSYHSDATYARDQLMEYAQTGRETDLRDAISHLTESAAAWLEIEILRTASSDKGGSELAAPDLPPDLAPAFKAQALLQLPSWLKPALLPPHTIQGKPLSHDLVALLLSALKKHSASAGKVLIGKIKEKASPTSLDKFAWELCLLWIEISAPSEEKWAIHAVSLLGGDLSILNLTPYIKRWPGEGYNGRSILGIDCLRGIGTDNALMALNGIAQKLKFKPLQRRAQKMIEGIAEERGLTADQLADRIVPDCGLDENASVIFDFGPRKFHLVLNKHLDPIIRDEAGNIRKDLSGANSTDDQEKSSEAIARWKTLKRTLKEIIRIQIGRLEYAMVHGRRWAGPEFELVFLQNRLLHQLARTVLWMAFDDDHAGDTFLVAEDRSCMNEKGEKIDILPFAKIGVAHLIHLKPEEIQKRTSIYSDFEIFPHFPQLNRDAYRPEPNELELTEIPRFGGQIFPGKALKWGLERDQWVALSFRDTGIEFDRSYKIFPNANLIAFMIYREMMISDYDIDQEIREIYFIRNLDLHEVDSTSKELRVKIKDVDPVILSEVLRLAENLTKPMKK